MEYATQVNGHVFSFSSIECTSTFDGSELTLERIASIDYEHSHDVGELRGVGPKVLGHGNGDYRARAELILYLQDWRAFRRQLARMPGPGGYMQKLFNITVRYKDDGEEPVEDVLRGCRVIAASRAYRRGSEPLMVAVRLFVTEIIEDGLDAVRFNDFNDMIAGLAAAGAMSP